MYFHLQETQPNMTLNLHTCVVSTFKLQMPAEGEEFLSVQGPFKSSFLGHIPI